MRTITSKTIERAIASFPVTTPSFYLDERPVGAVTICRDVCGVQAQVMSAAYLQLRARNHALTRMQIEIALWQTRTLIKTSPCARPSTSYLPTNFNSPSPFSGMLRRRCVARYVQIRIAREEGRSFFRIDHAGSRRGSSRPASHRGSGPIQSQQAGARLDRMVLESCASSWAAHCVVHSCCVIQT